MNDQRITTENKRAYQRRAVLLAAVLCMGISLCFMGGCNMLEKVGIGTEYVFRVGKEKCGEKEAKIILLAYQKEYGTSYGIDMWAHDYGEGASLEEYVKDLTLSQLAEVYTLDVIADEMEVALSEEEQKSAGKAAEAYYSGLAKEEITYLGVGKEDVQTLYERYALAKKVYSQLTENVEQEVSDDEARVMQAKQIFTEDAAKAESVSEQLKDGGDFSALADANNEAQTVDLTINRSDFSEDIIDQVFALQDGEASEVIETDQGYYIFYCVKAFDPELTEAHKADVLEQRMEDAVYGTYDSYASQIDSTLNEAVWDGVSVDTSLGLAGNSFLEVYDTYYP